MRELQSFLEGRKNALGRLLLEIDGKGSRKWAYYKERVLCDCLQIILAFLWLVLSWKWRGVAKIQEANHYCVYFDDLEPVATEIIVWFAELVATEAVCQSSIVVCGLGIYVC